MARIACLHVAGLAVAALCRAEPDLRGRPLAVVERDDPRAPLLAVSPEARAEGIRPGLSAAQARAASSRLLVRRVSAAQLAAAEAALADVAESFSPRVERAGGGVVFLDVDGLSTLFGSEGHLATSLVARARRVGLETGVGVAATKIVARLAARKGAVEVVPPGEERARLAPLPLAWLDPPRDVLATLARWGVSTLGGLASLPGESIPRRLGEPGLELWRRARGEDPSPLEPRARPLLFEEAVDCEYAIDSFEPLSFLLRAALERLVTRLGVRGLRAGDLEIGLRLADGGREDRVVRVAAPTAEVKVLLALVRVSFESRPPRGAVEELRLRAAPERLRPTALDLFAPPGPLPDELDVALARLAAIAGAGRVGAPATVDSHRPGGFAVARFDPAAARGESPGERGAGCRGFGPGTTSPGRPGERKTSDDRGLSAAPSPRNGGEPPCPVLALRAFRPPVPLEVACDRGRPDFIQGAASGNGLRLAGRVVACAGPWRLEAEWWRESPLARDDWDVEVSDGGVYRIYRELANGRWYAHGVYD